MLGIVQKKTVSNHPKRDKKLEPNKLEITLYDASANYSGYKLTKMSVQIRLLKHKNPSNNYKKLNGKVDIKAF